MLIFDDFSDLLVGFFMSINEVNNDIVSQREVSENEVLEEIPNTWNILKLR